MIIKEILISNNNNKINSIKFHWPYKAGSVGSSMMVIDIPG
jgi:hypothetical protein